jgi:succinate dehydrogenase/fumarate reductase flavoprotein subunit
VRAAFGPVIDRLAENHIDLTRMPVEVAPIAHYHMGGVKADASMATDVPGLYAAGEVVGGANGANRLSGNAITEALVFGRRAGRSAAERAKRMTQPKLMPQDFAATLDLIRAEAKTVTSGNTAAMVARLQATMADHVGPFRTGAKLSAALDEIAGLAAELGEHPPTLPSPASGGGMEGGAFDLQRLEWFDLRNMLSVAHAVTATALARKESRGAHQREDFPKMLPQWQVHQRVQLRDGALKISGAPAAAKALAS